MKFAAAIMLVALLTAFVVMITAAGERNDEARTGSGYGSGCPDPSACTTSCKAQGFLLGVCLQPLLQVCLYNKVRLVAEMKFTAAIILVALITAFVVMITAADERNDEARTGSDYGSGCPDPSACTASCKAKGFLLGVCLQPLLQICLCT
ncbi:uncharacterized protein [Dermacentor andersoni]|uniref:uncharacterized protein n=1 Tax=Dermacentor andersoni TaxID=34620 RepID=UPI002416AAE1|nr:uncharacterized protein LOC126544001 [Dermacentor andersoni]